MFEVLAFVYENYWGGQACPALPTLARKLHAVGFDHREVNAALIWLEELKRASCRLPRAPADACSGEPAPTLPAEASRWPASLQSMRLFTAQEQARLGAHGWQLLLFLRSIGALDAERLELVMDRAMAVADDPIGLDDLKLVVLMVFWSLDEEPDALVLDELCDHRVERLAS